MKIHYFNCTYKVNNFKIVGYDSLKNLIIYFNNNLIKININKFLEYNLNIRNHLKLFIYKDYYLSNLNIYKDKNVNKSSFDYNELPILTLEYQ